KVIIDGVPANSGQNGIFDFSSFSTDSIEKIEFVKSGFCQNVTSEGGSGGTIFITTKKQIPGHHFSSDTSLKSYFNLPLDSLTESIKYSGFFFDNTFINSSLKGTFAHNQYPFINYKNQKAVRKNNRIFDTNADLSLTTYTKNGNSLNIKDNFYYGNKEIPGTETSVNLSVQKDTDNLLSLGFTMPSLKEMFKINTNLSWQTLNQTYNSVKENSLHKLNTFTVQGNGTYFASTFFEESLGLMVKSDFLNSTDAGNVNQFSGFIKETTVLRPKDFINITVPLSVNFNGANFVFIPSIGVRFEIKNIALFTNASRLFLFPNLNQLYWKNTGNACGNPNLKPEDGISFELGMEAKNIPVPLSLTLFSNYYKNKIQWRTVNNIWTPQNTASAFYVGADLSLQYQPFSFLTFKLDYEYLYNTLLEEGASKGKRIMYTPEHTGTLLIKLNLDNFNISTSGHFVSKRYVSNLNISYLNPYFLWNAVFEYNPSDKIKIYLKGENLLNMDYEESEGYPMPGISLEAGIKFSL
ncbi:MAG: TonB-dependent receptor, partial [Treponema sp.]|nr:TonB-dependent receptor [Treponema sp.]